MKILLVDDNPLIQQVISRFLMGQEYSVFVASSAHDALSFAESQRYDLFLIDLHLSDEDGVDLLKTLRSRPQYAAVPAIAISGLGEEQRLRAHLDGFNGYLAKPIDLDELLGIVQHFHSLHTERVLGA